MDSGTGVSATIGTSSSSSGTTGAGTDTTGESAPLFTYHIGETQVFNDPCDNTTLTDVTSALDKILMEEGWTGTRFADGNTIPEHFAEQTITALGLDSSFSDASRLSVYAGHGNVNLLQWGSPSPNGFCTINLSMSTRLGLFAGNSANAVMFLTSCTGRVDMLASTLGASRSRQFFAFNNSPYIAGGEAADVFELTKGGQSNAEAWLNEMEDNIAIGKNSPVVMTIGSSSSDALEHHGSARLATGEGLESDLGLDSSMFFFEFIDNGCSEACGNCPPSTSLEGGPGVPTQYPVLELSRPQRSTGEVASRGSLFMTVFLGRILSDQELENIQQWAQGYPVSAASGACYGHPIASRPEIFLAYDPRTDALSVSNTQTTQTAGALLLQEGEYNQELPLSDLMTLSKVARATASPLNLGTDSVGSSFSVAMRRIGFGDLNEGIQKSSVAEVRFSRTRRVLDAQIFDSWVSIGLSPEGELTRLAIRGISSKVVGEVQIQIQKDDASSLMAKALESLAEQADRVDVEESGFGYILPPELNAAEVRPSYIFSIVTEKDLGAESVAVSRKRLIAVDAETGTVHAL